MREVDYLMFSFQDELLKEAALLPEAARLGSKVLGFGKRIAPRVSGALSGAGGGAGAGGVIGAGGGLALGGTKGYQEAREQGANRGQALLAGLGKGIGTAAKGAVIGAGAGALGGAALGAPAGGKLMSSLAQGEGVLAKSTRFGQRQVHGLTGATPKGFMDRAGVEQMRGGSWAAKKRVAAAKAGDEAAQAATSATPGFIGRLRGQTSAQAGVAQSAKATKELKAAKKGLDASEKATAMGLTSLPGYAKAVAKNPVKAISAGVGEQWHGSGPVGKALMFGFPGVTIGKELVTKSEPGGPGRVERAVKNVGDLAYTMGPVPIAGQIAAAGGLGAIGKRVSKRIGKVRKQREGHMPATPQLDPAGGEAVPAETIASERMSGMAGSGV
jgi:hypothetical protein